MDGVVESPSVPVEPHPFKHGQYQRALPAGREGAMQARVVDVPCAISQRCDQWDQLFLQLAEQSPDAVGLHLRLVVVEHDVVGAIEAGKALEALDVTALEYQVSLQMRRERCEVRLSARLYPCRLADRAGAGELSHQ